MNRQPGTSPTATLRANEIACPDSLLPSLRGVRFVCPLCRSALKILRDAGGYHCSSCERSYTLHGGIPDFRVFPDSYLSFQEDYQRTEIVLAALEHTNLQSLLEHYWSFSDITPEILRPKFIRSAMLGEQKARRTLHTLENGNFKKPMMMRRILEIGSGTGNFLALAAPRYKQAIGIDIAMRWLHVSRRRFMDDNQPVPPLVCCCAEYLPFADNSFDLIVASATLEFTRDPDKVLAECARVLTDTGSLYLNTVNRYGLTKDPYAYLWGVGFLPRAWQARYVRWRRGASYENIKPLSFSELSRIANKSYSSKEFALPEIDRAMLRDFSLVTRLQGRLYGVLRKLPLFNVFLKYFGPGWEVILSK